jgi:type I restriction enzyme R subunit
MNCFYERFGQGGSIGRENTAEVVLVPRLQKALQRLNPLLPSEALHLAIQALTRDRSAMNLARASQETYSMLKNGVKVSYQADGMEKTENVKLKTGAHPKTTITSWPPSSGLQVSYTSGVPIWWALLTAYLSYSLS